MKKVTVRLEDETARGLTQRSGEETARTGRRVSAHSIIIRALERELARTEASKK